MAQLLGRNPALPMPVKGPVLPSEATFLTFGFSHFGFPFFVMATQKVISEGATDRELGSEMMLLRAPCFVNVSSYLELY